MKKEKVVKGLLEKIKLYLNHIFIFIKDKNLA